MFEKYSNSRDVAYSFLIIGVFTAIYLYFPSFSVLTFNTQTIANSLLQLFGVLFVFILTIITIMFMFDYTKSPILRKLEKDNLFEQIFKRFFDTLIVISFSIIYLLVITIYFVQDKSITILNISIDLGVIFNFIILVLLLVSLIRIYRGINLLNLIYKSLTYKN